MVFSSITFLFFFLPVFLAAYFIVPSIAAKNAVTLLFSFLFYAWGEPVFVAVLLISTLFNFGAALAIDRATGAGRRHMLAAAVAVNLSVLGIFKYADFLIAALDDLLARAGIHVPLPGLPLPLGISFFTFHCLSYVIDVYRRRFPANPDFVQVALYISLFPQLVAGPIVRYKTVARQLLSRRHTLARASAGARIFVIGLAQKVLIADQLAQLVETVFDPAAAPSMAEAWTGLLAYAVQIYFDFAGYSNMAIGLGLIIGFGLPRNFRMPYTSLSVTEFWQRWHMSLSAWLRDYLYIPLGGSRHGEWRTYRNLIAVFLLCGLWHGASWNFVLWGGWHGAFLVLERVGLSRGLKRLPVALQWLYALVAVLGGWVLFRAQDLPAAAAMYRSLAGGNGIAAFSYDAGFALDMNVLIALAAGCILAVAPRRAGLKLPSRAATAVADSALTLGFLVLALVFVAAGTYSPFLYFRF